MIALALMFQASTIVLPYSWLEYCAAARDASCVVSNLEPTDLAYINKLIAETIITEADSSPLDPWVAFPANRRGDCDDHTVTARAALLALGVPASDMRVELGEVTEPDGRVVGHAVLVVTLKGREWVLDRKTPDSIYSPNRRPYPWRMTAVQPTSGVVWGVGEPGLFPDG